MAGISLVLRQRGGGASRLLVGLALLAGGFTISNASLATTDTAPTEIVLGLNLVHAAQEGTRRPVTVGATLSPAVALTEATVVTVTVGDSGDSATGGTDYTAVGDFTLTIAAGETHASGEFVFVAKDDAVAELDERVTVSGTADGFTVAGVSLTITDDEPPIGIRVSLAGLDEALEEGTRRTVTVTAALSSVPGVIAELLPAHVTLASDTVLTVAVGDSGDSATEGTDYTAVDAFTVTIPAGSHSGTATFVLDLADDDIADPDERVTVSATTDNFTFLYTSGPYSAVAVATGVGTADDFTFQPMSLTIIDTDTAPTEIVLGLNLVHAAQEGTRWPVRVGATLSPAVALTEATVVTVTVGDSGDSATRGTDYAAVGDFTLTIAAGETYARREFLFVAKDDAVAERNERVTVSGTADGFTVAGVSLTITDDEPPIGIRMSLAGLDEALEEGTRRTVTVTAALSSVPDVFAEHLPAYVTLASDTVLTVAVGDSGDSATEGTDYTAVDAFTVTIPAGSRSGTATFVLDLADDDIADPDERVTVSATTDNFTFIYTYGPHSAVAVATDSGRADDFVFQPMRLTIIDTDTAPMEIALSLSPVGAVEEGASPTVTVTATLSPPDATLVSDTVVTVAVGNSGDSATEGTDFTDVPDFMVTIPAGATSGSGTFDLEITEDTLVEGDEALTVSGSADLPIVPAALTIIDDDTPRVVLLNDAVGEGDGGVLVRVALVGGSVSGAFTITVVTADGSAAAGSDYTATTAELVFSGRWLESNLVTVPILSDNIIEEDETFTVRISGMSGVAMEEVDITDTATMRIIDDDIVWVIVTEGALTVGEGTSGTYTVVLGSDPGGTALISIAEDSSTTAPITVSPTSLSFDSTNWSTAQTVTVTADEDDDAEGGTRTLSHRVTGYGNVIADPVTVAVTDDDTPGVTLTPSQTTTLRLFSKRVRVHEDGAPKTYTVVLDTQPTGNVELTVRPFRLPQHGGHSPITITPTTLRFDPANWNTPQTVTVMAEEDDDVSDGLWFLEYRVSGYGTVTTAGWVPVLVLDSGDAGVTISKSSLTVEEGASGSYTVVLDTQPPGAVKVIIDPGADTAPPVLVTPASLTLSFDPTNWDTAQTVTVAAGEDDDAEGGTRTLSHRVTGYPNAAYDAVRADPVEVRVIDNETVAGVTISESALSVEEGASETYTVVLDTRPTGNVEVTIDPGGSLTDPVTVTPTSLSFDSTNWSTAQTVTVTADEDDDAEDGTRTLSHTVTGYGTVTTADPVTVAVTDDDTPGVTLTPSMTTTERSLINYLKVEEGGASKTYTVVLDTQPTGNVELTVEAFISSWHRGGNAPIAITPTTLRFNPTNWDTPQTVTVAADEDDDPEFGVWFLEYGVSGYGTVTTAGWVAVLVVDDDPAGVTISTSSLTVEEGASGSYTVVLDTQPPGAVKVIIDPGADTAPPVLVTPASLTLSFDPTNWDTAQTVTVAAGEDADAEGGTRTLSHRVTGYTTPVLEVVRADPVEVRVIDNDPAGVVTISESVLTVEEGASETYTVVLDTPPAGTAEVTIDSGGSLTGPVTVTPTSLSFDSTNWSTAQTVTVTADEDDDAEDGTRTLSHTVTGYGTVTTADPVTVAVTDDDTPGVTLTPSMTTTERSLINYLEVEEGGASKTYTVVLDTQPTGNVELTVEAFISSWHRGGNAPIAITPTTLRFNPTNWDTPQTVTVAADEDDDPEFGVWFLEYGVSGYGTVTTAGWVAVLVVDDDPAGVTISTSSLTVEEGASGSYTVVLDTQPPGAVKVIIDPGADTAPPVLVTPTSLTLSFDPTNWDTAQTVTVAAGEDADAEGGTRTLSHRVTGYTTPVLEVVRADPVEVRVIDNDPAGVVTISESVLTVEEGASETYTVVLDTPPAGTAEVTIDSGGSLTGPVTVTPTSLSFDSTNWSAAQTVTVTADEDDDAEDGTRTLSHTVTGYGTVTTADPVTVAVTDDDTPGVTLTPSMTTTERSLINYLEVDEGGASKTYTVVLDTQPTGNVELTVEAFISSWHRGGNAPIAITPTTLRFNPTNWDTPQTVTVAADEDDDPEFGVWFLEYGVSGYGTVTTAGWVAVLVVDDDPAGVTISTSSLTVEEGASGSYTVVLDTQPPGAVKVIIDPGADTAPPVLVTPASLTLSFDPTNWDTAQTVTVAAGEDADAEGGTRTLSHRVTGYTTPVLEVVRADPVEVRVIDNDPAGVVTISESVLTVEEGASETYTVVLDTPPAGTAEVTIDSGGSLTGPVTVTPTSLSFDSTNWSTAQTVTVTADEDDDAEDGTRTLSHTVTGYGTVTTADPVTVTVADDDTAGVTISESVLTVEEEASETYTVVLDTQPAGTAEITIDSGGSLTGPVTVTPTSLSFDSTNWSTAQTVTVTADPDDDAEDGTRTLSHTVTGYGTVTTADPVTVTVADDDTAGVTISESVLTVEEGASETYTVVLDTQPAGTAEITINSGGSLTGPITVTPTSLSFDSTNWSAAQTVTVTADPDDDAEDGTRTLSHTVTGYGTVTTADPVTVAVDDDDTAGVSITPTTLSVEEGASETYTVVLDTQPTGNVEVTIEEASLPPDSGATAPITVTPTTLHFGPTNWSAAQTVTVAADEDADAKGGKRELGHRVSGYTSTRPDPVTVTVTDNDHSDAALTLGDARAGAESGDATVSVTLNVAVEGGLTVTVTTTDGTAKSGKDYTEERGAELVFDGTANEVQTLKVAILPDNVAEGEESFTVGLSGLRGAAVPVDTSDTGRVTIPDDDNVGVAVTLGDPGAVAEGGEVTVTATLNVAVEGGFEVSVSTTAGTATSGGDYTALTGHTLTFAGDANEERMFTVQTTADTVAEGEESFTVGLSGLSGAPVAVAITGTARVAITDDDDSSAAVTLGDPGAVVEGGKVTVTATLNIAVEGGFEVSVSTTAGTATSGKDYTALTGHTLKFEGIENEEQVFTVETTADTVAEGEESFTVGLSGLSGAPVAVAITDTARVAITDDDNSGVALTLGNPGAVTEGGAVTVTATLNAAVEGGLTVTVETADGTATSGEDYTALTGHTLTFAGTANEKRTFTVQTAADTAAEGEESFTVGLSGLRGTAVPVDTRGTATVVITDDDTPPTGVVLSLSTSRVNEPSASTGTATTTHTVTATLTGGGTRTEETLVSVRVEGTATGGTADKNRPDADSLRQTDYVLIFDGYPFYTCISPRFSCSTTGTVSIPARTASGTLTFELVVMGDAREERDETLTFSGTTYFLDLPVAGTTLTITDADNTNTAAAVTLADPGPVREGGAVRMTATLNATVEGGLTVRVETADGTATSGKDYTALINHTLTFAGTPNEEQTFTVQTAADTVAEGNETFTVRFSGVGRAPVPVDASDTATVTITDAGNTAAAITLVDPDPVVEGSPVRMTARLNAEVEGGLTVRVETADGSATAGEDYTGLAGHTLTFAGAAGEEQSFMVQTMEDAVAERDMDFAVGLSGLAGTSAAVAITDRATVTIVDDDDAFAAVTLGNVRVGEENGEVAITAMLDVAIPGGFTVEVSTADGTARAGSDYTAVSGHTLTFAGNRSERQTFAVPILSDPLVEGEEFFTVSLSLPDDSPLTGASSSSGTVVITDDDTPAVTLGSGTVEEGAGTVTLTATLNLAVPGGFTVEASTADRTATAPGDYTALAGHTLTFAGTANEKQMFTVTVADDSDPERDETFRVMLDNLLGTAATVVTDDTGIVTITDDDIVPITLRLDPAQVVDTTGTVTVSVTASAPAGSLPATAVEIAVTVAGNTAVAGEDFTPVPAFTISLAAGAARGTGAFVLTVAGADGQEGAETLAVSGKADGFAVRSVPLTLIDETSLALESVGGELVREAIADVSNVVADRVSHQIAGSGQRFDWSTSLAHGLAANQQALNDGNWSWRELLDRSSFEFRIGEDPDGLSASDSPPSGPSGIGLWAAAEGRRLSSGGGDFGDYDGRLFFVHAGADMPIGRGLAGLAVSSSRGSFDFDDNALDADTELVNYTLYLGAPLEDAANLWATLGYGTGEIVSGPAGARNPRDIKMTAASLGGRANVLAEDGLAVDFEGEVSTGRLKFENGTDVVNPAADVRSLRLALDLGKDTESDTGIVLTRSVAFGVRLDGGDGETGAGISLKGGLSRADPASGLTAELTGDVLFSRKEDSRTREGGLGGAVRYRQNPSGRGLLLRTSFSYNTGIEDLTRRWLEDGTAGGDSPDAAAFDAEVGYGLRMLRGNGMLTPYLGFQFTRENARHYLLGSRVRIGPALELELESAWLEKVLEKDSEARLDLRIQGKW